MHGTPFRISYAADTGTYLGHREIVYIGFGVLHGLGCSHSYISTVSAVQKWYPDRKGVAAGVAVFGMGA